MDDRVNDLAEQLASRKISRRTFIQRAGALGLAASSISGILAACSAPSQPSSGASAAGGAAAGAKILSVAVEADISSLRPDRFGPFMDRYANRTLYDLLVHFKTMDTPQGPRYDPDHLEYHVASAMDVSPDGKTVTFTIRDDATFRFRES